MEAFAVSLPADPASLAPLRSELEQWLETAGVQGRLAFDAVAAMSEATSNAIEHAQEPSSPRVEISAVRANDVLRLQVRDFGQWRPPRLDSDRNHGLLLIDSLMTRVEIDRTAQGTTVTMELELGDG